MGCSGFSRLARLALSFRGRLRTDRSRRLAEVETSLDIFKQSRDAIRLPPVRSAFALLVYVAASPAAPFSTTLC
jgi:hypothetical protein